MRFTSVLNQVNYKRHFGRVWKRQGRLQATELQIPPELQELGVCIKDAKDILLETKLFKPKPVRVTVLPKPPSALHRDKCYFVMDSDTEITENENQCLALTKTLMYKGLPKVLTNLVGIDYLPNQDELVQTSILQSHVWDADQHKLPKKFDESRPAYVFKREYGILKSKKVTALMEKLSYLGDCATGKYPACLIRNKVIDAFSGVNIQRKGEDITFQMSSDTLVTSDKPLKCFALPSEVRGTRELELASIYPLKPTLDLVQMSEKPPISSHFEHQTGHLHTLLFTHKTYDKWLPHQLLARAVGTCFAFAAKVARATFGANIKELPEPVAVQCIYSDLNAYNFVAYQLNTLNMDSDDGIKNQVWVDEPSTLYSDVSELKLITDYNPSVFTKFLAFYINGLHSSSL